MRIRGLLAGVASVIWAAALLIALGAPPASGYELSIVEGFPEPLWVLTFLTVAASTATLLLGCHERPRVDTWVASAAIVATNALLIALPAMHGYAVSDRADPLTHIGFSVDIARTGGLSSDDFYPALHILQVLGTEGLGLDAGQILVAISVAFSVVWTAGICMLAGELSRDDRTIPVALAVSSALALVSYNALPLPSTLSAILVPVAVALHLRRGRNEPGERLPLVIAEIGVAIAIVLLHPVTALYLLMLLAALELARLVSIRVFPRSMESSGERYFPQAGGMLAVLTAILAAWTTSFAILIENAAGVVRWLLSEQERPSALDESFGLLEAARLEPLGLAWILFNAVGLPVLVSAAAALSVAATATHSLRLRRAPAPPDLAAIALVGSALTLALLLFLISSSERYPVRLLRIAVVIGLPVIAWRLTLALVRTGRRARIATPAYAAILIAVVIGQTNLYPNPRNALPNTQVMEADLAAGRWLLEHRTDEARQATSVPNYVSRINTSQLGSDGVRARLPRWWEVDLWLPTGIIDPEWSCAADASPGRTTYFVLPGSAEIAPLRFPPEIRSLARHYEATDILKLRDDASIDKVYDNGFVEVWVTAAESCS